MRIQNTYLPSRYKDYNIVDFLLILSCKHRNQVVDILIL